MEFGVVLQPNPPASRGRGDDEAGRGGRVRLRLDVRLACALAGDVRDLPPDPGADPKLTVGPMVTNPGTRDWSVIASMFATLNDDVRQPDDLRHRARRLRPPVHRPAAGHAGHAVGRDDGHQGAGRRARGRCTTASRCASRGCATARCRCGWRPTGPKALRLAGEQADGFILQTADPDIARWTFGSVRAAAADAGRDPSSITMCVAAPGLRGDRPGAPAGAAALVRRHGRQPRRRPGGAVRDRRAGAAGADRLHRRAPGLRLLAPRAGRATRPPTSCRTRSSTGSASSARRRPTSSGSGTGGDRRRPVRAVPACTTTRIAPWTPTASEIIPALG